MTWVSQLLSVLTQAAWPLVTIIFLWPVRLQLVDFVKRLKHAEGPGFKLDTDPGTAGGPGGALPERPAEVRALPPQAEARVSLPHHGASGPPQAYADALPSGPPASAGSDDPWRRCGNIYWLGNNIVFTALAIAADNVDSARKEFDNALWHAAQLPLDPALVQALSGLARHNWSDSGAKDYLVNELVRIGSFIGRAVAHHQADFPQHDVWMRQHGEKPP